MKHGGVLLNVVLWGIVVFLIAGFVVALIEGKQIQSALENGTNVDCLWESSTGVHSQTVYLVRVESHSYVVCVEDGKIRSSMEVRAESE